MSVSQISVFIESKPGYMKDALDALANAQVSIRGYCASDTGDYGIVRFVVDNAETGLAALTEAGFAAKIKPVLCVRLKDDPGELGRVLGVVAGAGVNVLYSYSLVGTFVAIQAEDLPAAEKMLEAQDLELVDDNDILI